MCRPDFCVPVDGRTRGPERMCDLRDTIRIDCARVDLQQKMRLRLIEVRNQIDARVCG